MKLSNKKKLFLLVFLSLLILTVAIVVQDYGRSQKHYAAIIVKSTQSAFWKAVFSGAGAAGAEYNISLTCEGPDREEDYETQNALIQKAVSSGAEAIIFSAVDYEANAQAISDAARKGIKIVVIDSDVNSDAVQCRIGTDNFAAGRMAGEAALCAGGEELHIGIVNYDVNTANGQQREQGFRDAVSKDDRIKDVTTINVISTTEDAKAGTIMLLQEHPEINVLATFNEWTSLGVGWAIRELSLKDSTYVVAFDNNVVSVGMLESGEVDALVVQNPYAMGYLGVEQAKQLIQGKRLASRKIDTETTVITRENMFQPEYQRILFMVE